MTVSSTIPFHLRGNYAPVTNEISAENLEVRGSLPSELNGRYFRNGANPITGESAHWFLGDGMIHGVRLRDGKAEWYRNRWVQTSLVKDGKKPSIDKADNMSNTSIIAYGGKLLSLMEIGFPYEINPDLSTKGVYRFDSTHSIELKILCCGMHFGVCCHGSF